MRRVPGGAVILAQFSQMSHSCTKCVFHLIKSDLIVFFSKLQMMDNHFPMSVFKETNLAETTPQQQQDLREIFKD